jgi:hypothetical protein
MAEPHRDDSPGLGLSFTPPAAEPASRLPWAIAGLAIALVVVLLVIFGGHRAAPTDTGSAVAPPDPYAASLAVTDLKMSEASNFAGGKVTYVDGKIANRGDQTVDAVTVQVVFRTDLKEIAQKETLPLSLIRTREPYVDTQPVSASPLKPGEEREFRLVFDSISADWNRQYPEVRVVQVGSRSSGK